MFLTSSSGRFWGLVVLVVALLLPRLAVAQGSGDPKKGSVASAECIQAYEAVQSLREQGKLIDAREKSLVCARETCPKVLATECAQWLEKIAESTPTVVLAATDPAGKDLVAVKVSVDGRVVLEELGSRAVPVDPGAHKFSFESKELGAAEIDLVIREGEKNRKVSVTFSKTDLEKPGPSGQVERPVPVAFWLVGSVGAVAVVGGVIFESLGLAKAGELDACKPGCAAGDVAEMSRDFLIGDVALGVGTLGLASALIIYFTRPEAAAARAAAPIGLDLSLGLTGAVLRGSF